MKSYEEAQPIALVYWRFRWHEEQWMTTVVIRKCIEVPDIVLKFLSVSQQTEIWFNLLEIYSKFDLFCYHRIIKKKYREDIITIGIYRSYVDLCGQHWIMKRSILYMLPDLLHTPWINNVLQITTSIYAYIVLVELDFKAVVLPKYALSLHKSICLLVNLF